MDTVSWPTTASQGTKPWRSLLAKRSHECDCGTEASDDGLHRCTSNESNVSDACHFGDAERLPVGADGFVMPNTPVKRPATIGCVPCGPSPTSVPPPSPELYDWESDGCRTPDQPIPAPTGPPPAPSRFKHVRPLMPDGGVRAVALLRQLMPRQLSAALQAAARTGD